MCNGNGTVSINESSGGTGNAVLGGNGRQSKIEFLKEVQPLSMREVFEAIDKNKTNHINLIVEFINNKIKNNLNSYNKALDFTLNTSYELKECLDDIIDEDIMNLVAKRFKQNKINMKWERCYTINGELLKSYFKVQISIM
jgi:hypothetical protein